MKRSGPVCGKAQAKNKEETKVTKPETLFSVTPLVIFQSFNIGDSNGRSDRSTLGLGTTRALWKMDWTGSLQFLLEGLVLASLYHSEEFAPAQDTGSGENCESVHFLLSNTVAQSKRKRRPSFSKESPKFGCVERSRCRSAWVTAEEKDLLASFSSTTAPGMETVSGRIESPIAFEELSFESPLRPIPLLPGGDAVEADAHVFARLGRLQGFVTGLKQMADDGPSDESSCLYWQRADQLVTQLESHLSQNIRRGLITDDGHKMVVMKDDAARRLHQSGNANRVVSPSLATIA